MHAFNQEQLEKKLSDAGFFLLSLKVNELYEGKRNVKIKEKEKISLTRNLASLLQGGLSLAESLQGLTQDSKDPNVVSLLVSVSRHVEAGGSLERAFKFHPRTFSRFYTSTVASGESTGALGKTISQLADHLEWRQQLKKKIIELSIYPVIVVILMFCLLTGLFLFILPRFEQVFSELGTELPLLTQIAMQISDIFSSYWYIIFGIFFALIIGVFFALKHPAVKFFFDHYKLKLPIFGKLIYNVTILKFVRSMELCLGNGITIISALELSEGSLGNLYLEKAVEGVKKSVAAQGDLTTPFNLAGVFPNNLIRMIYVGESSGSLPAAFTKARQHYDREVPHMMQTVFSVLEPLLIVVMGVVVGSIALIVILPLVELMQMG